ncbi:MAG: hypothetical protein J5518_02070 [Lachnospiraceae bacterium]|nr:hypothetical protein [Lachnospiraceae bacterium]
MADQKNLLNDDELTKVSGGATDAGFPTDQAGNVYFTDKNGKSYTFTAAQWQVFRNKWSYTGPNPEAYFKDVPLEDLLHVLKDPSL